MIAHLTLTPWQKFLTVLKRSVLIFLSTIAGGALGVPIGMILGMTLLPAILSTDGMGVFALGIFIGVAICSHLLPTWLFWQRTREHPNRSTARKIFAAFTGASLCLIGLSWTNFWSYQMLPPAFDIFEQNKDMISSLVLWVPTIGAGVATFLSDKRA